MRRPQFRAQYPGTCNACGERFAEDTLLSYDDTDRTVHAELDECGSDTGIRITPQRQPNVCPECHLSHAGECL